MNFPKLVHQWDLGSIPCFATSWLYGLEQGFDLPPEPPFLHLENCNNIRVGEVVRIQAAPWTVHSILYGAGVLWGGGTSEQWPSGPPA